MSECELVKHSFLCSRRSQGHNSPPHKAGSLFRSQVPRAQGVLHEIVSKIWHSNFNTIRQGPNSHKYKGKESNDNTVLTFQVIWGNNKIKIKLPLKEIPEGQHCFLNPAYWRLLKTWVRSKNSKARHPQRLQPFIFSRTWKITMKCCTPTVYFVLFISLQQTDHLHTQAEKLREVFQIIKILFYCDPFVLCTIPVATEQVSWHSCWPTQSGKTVLAVFIIKGSYSYCLHRCFNWICSSQY